MNQHNNLPKKQNLPSHHNNHYTLHVYTRWINWLASFPSYRSRKLPEAQAQAIRTHFAEELHSLSAFLPKYYEHTRAKLEAEIGRLSLQQ
jgi:hypothetical protein